MQILIGMPVFVTETSAAWLLRGVQGTTDRVAVERRIGRSLSDGNPGGALGKAESASKSETTTMSTGVYVNICIRSYEFRNKDETRIRFGS